MMSEHQIWLTADVFTPNRYPAHTYVSRADRGFEARCHTALMTPNICISVSGPSKSGKTVLLHNVVGSDNLIRVFGAQIKSPDQLWDLVLDWMQSPSSTAVTTASAEAKASQGGLALKAGVPGFFEVSPSGSIGQTNTDTSSTTATRGRGGLAAVAKEIGNSDFVVFVDDYHYMDRPLQTEIAKQIKAALELGIKVAVASVPHRSDDVVRANPELRGRVLAVDMEFWRPDELEQIGQRGFPLLGMTVKRETIEDLARQACGSPQLMQSLCLHASFQSRVNETAVPAIAPNFTSELLRNIYEHTSSMTDFSTMVEKMHEGPKQRGSDRAEYGFLDGTSGDVYRCVLLALAKEPPAMSVPYSELMARVQSVCTGKAPVGSSVAGACEQIAKIAKQVSGQEVTAPGQPPLEWDKPGEVETMHIVDPYFLFYLRASRKLDSLGKRSPPATTA